MLTRRRRNGLWGAAAATVLLAGAGLTLFLPGSSTPIVNAADELTVPESWVLVSERTTAPRRVCLGASPCPSLHRTWETGRPLDAAAMRELLADSGWDLELDGDCTVDPSSYGRYEVCAARGRVDDFAATVSHDASLDDPGSSQVQLDLRPVP